MDERVRDVGHGNAQPRATDEQVGKTRAEMEFEDTTQSLAVALLVTAETQYRAEAPLPETIERRIEVDAAIPHHSSISVGDQTAQRPGDQQLFSEAILDLTGGRGSGVHSAPTFASDVEAAKAEIDEVGTGPKDLEPSDAEGDRLGLLGHRRSRHRSQKENRRAQDSEAAAYVHASHP